MEIQQNFLSSSLYIIKKNIIDACFILLSLKNNVSYLTFDIEKFTKKDPIS